MLQIRLPLSISSFLPLLSISLRKIDGRARLWKNWFYGTRQRWDLNCRPAEITQVHNPTGPRCPADFKVFVLGDYFWFFCSGKMTKFITPLPPPNKKLHWTPLIQIGQKTSTNQKVNFEGMCIMSHFTPSKFCVLIKNLLNLTLNYQTFTELDFRMIHKSFNFYVG